MAELKSAKNALSPTAFIAGIEDEGKRQDAKVIDKMMREITGDKPAMYGANIVGYGKCIVTYADGRKMDWMATGFSPRKQAMTLYLMSGFEQHDKLMSKLGKHSTGKGCLYVKKLADIDLAVLRELVERSYEEMRAKA